MSINLMNLAAIRGKYILLDAGIVMQLARSPVLLEEFTKLFISESKCLLVTIPSVSTEFINGAARDSDIKGFNTNAERLGYALEFLDDLISKELPVTEERSNYAKILAIVNSYALCDGKEFDINHKQIPKPSFVDFTIGSMTFQPDLVLATLNHQDFPLYLYDRLALYPFADNNSVKTVGFYEINESKYADLIQNASKHIKKAKLLKGRKFLEKKDVK